MLKIIKNPAYLFTSICLILEIKRIVNYPDIISVILTLYVFLCAFLCAYKLLSHRKCHNSYLNGILTLLILFTIYGTICVINGETYSAKTRHVPNDMYIMDIYKSLLPIFVYYYYSYIGLLTEKAIKNIFYIWCAIYIVEFYVFGQNYMQSDLYNGIGVVNNNAYAILSLLIGISIFDRKPRKQYVIISIVAFFVIISGKRGTMIIFPICLLYYIIISIKNKSFNSKIIILFLSTCFIIAFAYYIQYKINNDVFFQSRIELTEEGGSSGRDILFSTFWEHFKTNDNILQQIFGEGAMATIRVSYNFAHNDWLEILINNGIFGVLIYLIYWWKTIKVWYSSRHYSDISLAFGLFIIIYLMKTFFSMSYSDYNYFTTCILGYYLAKYDNVILNSQQ